MRVVLRFVVRVFAWLVAGAILIPTVGLLAYDIFHFRPHLPEINQMIASATEEERNPPETVVRRMRAAFSQSLALEASRVLLQELTDEQTRKVSSLRWQVRGTLWWACVALHLSERQQITLIASRRSMGRGLRGFSATSQSLFKRPLASTSLGEAATIVSMYPAPNHYLGNPEALAKRRDSLLSRLQSGP